MDEGYAVLPRNLMTSKCEYSFFLRALELLSNPRSSNRCMLRVEIPSKEASSDREYANFGLTGEDI
jgi:hypothetical protein